MIECRKINGSCVNMQIDMTGTGEMVSADVQLENDITPEEFMGQIGYLLDPENKLIAISQEEVGIIFGDKRKVSFGRFYFSKSERFYVTCDSLDWLRKLQPMDVCIFVESNAYITEIGDVINLLKTAMPVNANIFIALLNTDLSIIKLNVLAG